MTERETTDAGCLAGDILRAWAREDMNGLEAQWSRTLNCIAAQPHGVEGEHRMLLRAIVSRMKRCRSLFARRHEDPGLDLCIDLLAHLVSRETAPLSIS